jgi:sRNA-binding carbon storage regulator CsrA
MLILTREIGQAIVIGEGKEKVVIRVEDLYRNGVSISIDAPEQATIRKGERAKGQTGCTICSELITKENHGVVVKLCPICKDCLNDIMEA